MTKITLIFLLQISVFSSLLSAQSDSLDLDLRIGIGATLEKEYGVKTYRYTPPSVGITKLYLPIIYKSKLKIVPEFGYWDYNVEYYENKYSYTITHYGINLNYIFLYKPALFYFGPRFAVDHVVFPYFEYDEEFKDSKNDYIYGLTLGGEYFLSNHFTMGFDLQFNFFKIGKEAEESQIEEKVKALESVIYFCFYF
jgi:hypothetical protein